MRPRPTTPTVFSATSTPVYFERFHCPARSAAWAWETLRALASSSATASSAALVMLDCGALTTMTPALVAAGTSTLSRPTPARATTFSLRRGGQRLGVHLGGGADQDRVDVRRSRPAARTDRRRRSVRISKSGPRASTVAGESSSAINTTGLVTTGSFGLGWASRQQEHDTVPGIADCNGPETPAPTTGRSHRPRGRARQRPGGSVVAAVAAVARTRAAVVAVIAVVMVAVAAAVAVVEVAVVRVGEVPGGRVVVVTPWWSWLRSCVHRAPPTRGPRRRRPRSRTRALRTRARSRTTCSCRARRGSRRPWRRERRRRRPTASPRQPPCERRRTCA